MFTDVMDERIGLCENPDVRGVFSAAMYAGVGICEDCMDVAEQCVRIKEFYKPVSKMLLNIMRFSMR